MSKGTCSFDNWPKPSKSFRSERISYGLGIGAFENVCFEGLYEKARKTSFKKISGSLGG